MYIDNAIKDLVARKDLTEEQCKGVINEIIRAETTSAQIGAFLIGLRVKGETQQELLGAVKALRENMTRLDVDHENLIDTCGTGGDGGKTFNISTAVAIVAASGGAKVAKHGNRAVSSKSGSADVLKELGISIDLDEIKGKELIEKVGMTFLFAPNFQKAMKNVAKERQELATRTIFNLIGPLVNPAPIRGQLLGIYDGALLKTIGEVLLNLGIERAMVVHGDDGLDEITTTTTTSVCEINNNNMKIYKINPKDFGIPISTLKDIEGGTPKENADIILNVLKGEKGPRRDIVVLNSGAALYVSKKANSLEEGIEQAKYLIDSGLAFNKYTELVQGCKEVEK